MSRMLPILLCAALPLSACAPASSPGAPAGDAAAAPGAIPSPARPAADAASPMPQGAPADATPAKRDPAPAAGGASIAGAIRDGNRAPPALHICALPVRGGAPSCVDSPAGARAYRLEVAPGRYRVLGWARGGELAVIAHAEQIRCIRAPCPPDRLLEVQVGPGEQREGVDLAAGYPTLPDGWPARPR